MEHWHSLNLITDSDIYQNALNMIWICNTTYVHNVLWDYKCFPHNRHLPNINYFCLKISINDKSHAKWPDVAMEQDPELWRPAENPRNEMRQKCTTWGIIDIGKLSSLEEANVVKTTYFICFLYLLILPVLSNTV